MDKNTADRNTGTQLSFNKTANTTDKPKIWKNKLCQYQFRSPKVTNNFSQGKATVQHCYETVTFIAKERSSSATDAWETTVCLFKLFPGRYP